MSDEERQDEQPVVKDKRVDEDWKSRVEAERKKEEEEAAEKAGQPGSGEEPKENPLWPQFLSSLAAQTLMMLGQEPDPISGQHVFNPQQARYTIDLIGMLREKTAGNLTLDERRMTDQIYSELQMMFVEVSKQAAAQQSGEGPVSSPPE
jgi:hypothetical protein